MFANRHLSESDDNKVVLQELISDGPTLGELRNAGYETIAVSSGYNGVDLRSADRIVTAPQLSGLEVALLRSTVLGPLIETVSPGLVDELHRSRIRETFDDVVSISREPADHPRFVFAHVPAPHGPWVFGRDGSPRADGLNGFYTDSPVIRGISEEEALRRSLDQATQIGVMTIQTIDEVLPRVDPSTVIVVFSDHGPRLELNPEDPTDNLGVRASNLIAIRFPGARGVLPPATTPINIIPRILNAIGHPALDILPDETRVWHRDVGQ
jgi:hypothetical protein